MTNPTVSEILTRIDKGDSVAEIAATLTLSPGYVYSVLRAERPDRARKVHKKWSDRPSRIAALHLENVEPAAIAERLEVSRAYVYRHLPRAKDGAILPPCPVPAQS